MTSKPNPPTRTEYPGFSSSIAFVCTFVLSVCAIILIGSAVR